MIRAGRFIHFDESERRRFGVETFANGLFAEITSFDHGSTVFLQGAEAIRFVEDLDRAGSVFTSDDVLSMYFE